MLRSLLHHTATLRRSAMPVAAVAGVAAAILVSGAIAKTFTLRVAHNASVTNASGSTFTETIAVNPHGRAVYLLTGDSRSHPKCTKANGCFQFWLPVTVGASKKPSKAPGIKHRLRTWHRSGLTQLVLGGHPLYTYIGDHQRDAATGEGIKTFGGTWHVIRASGGSSGTGTTPGSSSSTTMPSTTTTPCFYPPCA